MCHEPMASQSPLARSVLSLLESEVNSDLEFIIPADPEQGQGQIQGQILKAHRVILAARCHWFHRALLSGMREAIDRYSSHLKANVKEHYLVTHLLTQKNFGTGLFCLFDDTLSAIPLRS